MKELNIRRIKKLINLSFIKNLNLLEIFRKSF